MKILLSRETVVISKFQLELSDADAHELSLLLESERGVVLRAFETIADFLEEIKRDRLEMDLFEVMKDYKSNQMDEEYRDGESYSLDF